MTLVKEELQHRLLERNLTQTNDDTTDALGISVKRTELDLKCINLYILPIRRDLADERTKNFSRQNLPDNTNTVIDAEANAQSVYRDSQAEENKIGEKLVEWMRDKEIVTLNNYSRIKTCQSTRNGSAPEVTIVHCRLSRKCKRRTHEDSLSSDHHPVVTEIKFQQNRTQRSPTSQFIIRKANRALFEEETNHLLTEKEP